MAKKRKRRSKKADNSGSSDEYHSVDEEFMKKMQYKLTAFNWFARTSTPSSKTTAETPLSINDLPVETSLSTSRQQEIAPLPTNITSSTCPADTPSIKPKPNDLQLSVKSSNWISSTSVSNRTHSSDFGSNLSFNLNQIVSKKIFAIVSSLLLGVGFSTIVFCTIWFVVKSSKEYNLDKESEISQFYGVMQVVSIDNEFVLWKSDLENIQSEAAQNLVSQLKLPIRDSLEAEGFSISQVDILNINSFNETLYYVNDQIVSSISLGNQLQEIMGKNNSNIKINKHRIVQAVTVEFKTYGKPSKNGALLSRVGENELIVVQFMLNNYLEHQNIIANVKSITVDDDFRLQVKKALQIISRLADLEIEEDKNIVYVACHKPGTGMYLDNMLVRCPPDCLSSSSSLVVGSEYYQLESSVCLAAIHSHVILNSYGGVVEFLKVGKGFIFTGKDWNGINSTSKIGYSERFIVKKPGPTWINEFREIEENKIEPLQEKKKPLMKISFSLLKYDSTETSYSSIQLRDTPFSQNVKATLPTQVKYSMQLVEFVIAAVKIISFKPLPLNSRAVQVNLELFGEHSLNTWALFPYKPWEESQIAQLEDNLMNLLLHHSMELDDLKVKVNGEFLEYLMTSPSTTFPPLSKYTGKCGCGEVFFIQSLESMYNRDDYNLLTDLYADVFNNFNFDQINLGLGFAVISPTPFNKIVTNVGQDLSNATLRKMSDVFLEFSSTRKPSSVENIGREKLWKMIAKMQTESNFLRRGVGKRKKLLVVISRYIDGHATDLNFAYLAKLKRKGILVAYLGYDWGQNKLERHYNPQKFASQPALNFVRHVDAIEDVKRLSLFINDVIRNYICMKPPETCESLSHIIPPPDDLSFNLTTTAGNETIGSYYLGIPKGRGLKQFPVGAGRKYGSVHLPKTSTWRKFPPDKQQAFYRLYSCGQQANQPVLNQAGRIVGGSEAVPHSWPWTISINIARGKYSEASAAFQYSYNYWNCGGTIIDRLWVVTAAHCFADGSIQVPTTNYQVVVGMHDQEDLTSLQGNVYKIDKIVYHPEYNDPRNQFDIALLKLDREIIFNREVAPACLPNPDVILRTNSICFVAGWGFTSNTADTKRNKLKQAIQYIEQPWKCQKTYQRYYYDPNYNFCAKRSADSDNPNIQCRGDSGGPLVCRENERWVLYGVSNFGPKFCENGGEGGYFLVPSVLDWLCCYMEPKFGPCAYVTCSYGHL